MKKVFINEFYNFVNPGFHGTISPEYSGLIKVGEYIQDQNDDISK